MWTIGKRRPGATGYATRAAYWTPATDAPTAKITGGSFANWSHQGVSPDDSMRPRRRRGA